MRILSLLAIVLIAPSAPATASSMNPQAVVARVFAAINAHDATALAALYASDAVSISSDTCKPSIGPEPVRIGHEALIKAMPDLRVAVTEWVVDGEHVAVQFTAYSKALGPTGQAMFGDFLTVKNGKITRDVTLFNPGEPCR